jgi:hypothetical protein
MSQKEIRVAKKRLSLQHFPIKKLKSMNHLTKLLLLLLITACSSNSKKNENGQIEDAVKTLPVIKIRRPSGELPLLKLSEIAENIKYLKLETHDDALLSLGSVFRSDESNDMFFVYRRQIYKFDKTGKYIRRIGRSGQGSGEFTPDKVQVDFQKKFIYVFPGEPGRERDCVLKLDFEGNLLERIQHELVSYPEIMTLLNGNLIFVNELVLPGIQWYKNGYMHLYYFNLDSRKVDFYLPNPYLEELKDRRFTSVHHQGKFNLAKGKNVAYYKYLFNDTIYRITDKGINPFLVMDLGDGIGLEDYLEKGDLKRLFTNNILIYMSMAFENHLLFWFTKYAFSKERDVFIGLYDIKTGKMSYYDDYVILNDLDGGPNYNGEFFRDILEISTFKDADKARQTSYYRGHDTLKELKYPERKDEFKKLLDMSKEDDNPILRIVTFKDDF